MKDCNAINFTRAPNFDSPGFRKRSVIRALQADRLTETSISSRMQPRCMETEDWCWQPCWPGVAKLAAATPWLQPSHVSPLWYFAHICLRLAVCGCLLSARRTLYWNCWSLDGMNNITRSRQWFIFHLPQRQTAQRRISLASLSTARLMVNIKHDGIIVASRANCKQQTKEFSVHR